MLRIRKHRYFGLRRSAPEEVHNRTILGIYCLNDRISELLPASSLMGIRLVRAHGEDGVEQKHSLICPFFQITVIRNVTAQIIMQFLINVLQGRRDLLTVSLLQEKGYDPIVYRMFCLQSHYRKPLEFSYEVLDNMSVAYKKLVKRIADLKADGTVDEGKFAEYKEKFCDAISNDLNTSMAITIVYDLLKDDTLNDATKRALAEDFDGVLSLNLTTAKVENPAEDTEVDAELEAYILEKIEERKAAKKEKDFAKADAIRDDLLAKGIVLKDTREGVIWHKA